MTTDIVLAGLGAILIVIGYVGSVVPMLPGPPLAWVGLLLAFFSAKCEISLVALIICAVIAIAVTLFDTFCPVIFTKGDGGTKAGVRGSTIGLLIGLFTGPWGLILGPFIGAFIGELCHNPDDKSAALKSAWGSFKGFLAGTGSKLIVCAIYTYVYIAAILKATH